MSDVIAVENNSGAQAPVPLTAHPKCLLLPEKTGDEMAGLKENLMLRQERGLPPLEHPILLKDGQILDGRHRYKVWMELAAENACGGWFAQNPPPMEAVEADDEVMALRIAALNLSGRNLRSEQRAAIWLELIEQTPALRGKLEAMEKQNRERMKAGKKPLAATGQGSVTSSFLAKGANVGKTTMKDVKRVKRELPPEDFAKLLQGRATVSNLLKKIEQKPKNEKAIKKPKPLSDPKPGDEVYILDDYEQGQGDIHILKKSVLKVEGLHCHFSDGEKKDKDFVFSKEQAVLRRQVKLQQEIESLTLELKDLKTAQKSEPQIVDNISAGKSKKSEVGPQDLSAA